MPFLKSKVNIFSILSNDIRTIKCSNSDYFFHLLYFHCLVCFSLLSWNPPNKTFFNQHYSFRFTNIFWSLWLPLLFASYFPLRFISLITLTKLLNPTTKERSGKEIYPTMLISGLSKVIFVKVLYKFQNCKNMIYFCVLNIFRGVIWWSVTKTIKMITQVL